MIANRNSNRLTREVGEPSTIIQPTLEEQLVDLTLLLEANTTISSTDAAHVILYEVSVSVVPSKQRISTEA
jgi:hypothetical protein